MTLKYEYDKAALKATVCGVEDCGTNVVIPATVEYYKKVYKVTSIGKSAFEGCKVLESIVIPNNVASIGDSAFTRCESLTSIEIPQSVTRIHERAFLFCESLSSIKVDPGNTIYDSRDNCNAIIETQTNTLIHGCNRTVILGSVTSIGKYAFHYRACLTNVVFPAGLKSIGEGAFMYCSRLASLEIPNSVTSIGNKAFHGCSALNRVEVGYSNAVYDSRDNCNAIIETRTNALIKGGNMTVIPNGVTSIGNNAFYDCSGLTSIEIPNSVTSIGDSAFSGCKGLKNVTIGNRVTSIGGSAFSGCSGLISVVIPNSVTSIGNSAFNCCSGLTSIEIPSSVTSIGHSAFYCCSRLTSIEIPSSVTSIGGSAFSGCSGLTSVVIPNSVTSIEGTFYGCTGLTSVEIPNSVTSIGRCTFYNCSHLTDIVIPNSVTSISGDGVFSGCSALNRIEVDPGNTIYDSRDNCNAIIETQTNTLIYGSNKTVIPNSIASIAEFAFSGSSLTSIVIPSSVTIIRRGTFYGCTCLSSVEIPNSVTTILYEAFRDCNNLSSIEIPKSVTRIGEGAFYGCSKLKHVIIYNKEDKITIAYNAFSHYHSVVEYADEAQRPITQKKVEQLTEEVTPKRNSGNGNSTPRRFVRSSTDKKIAGVCGGIASWLGINSLFVRIVAFITYGFLFWGYILLWILMPRDDK